MLSSNFANSSIFLFYFFAFCKFQYRVIAWSLSRTRRYNALPLVSEPSCNEAFPAYTAPLLPALALNISTIDWRRILVKVRALSSISSPRVLRCAASYSIIRQFTSSWAAKFPYRSSLNFTNTSVYIVTIKLMLTNLKNSLWGRNVARLLKERLLGQSQWFHLTVYKLHLHEILLYFYSSIPCRISLFFMKFSRNPIETSLEKHLMLYKIRNEEWCKTSVSQINVISFSHRRSF